MLARLRRHVVPLGIALCMLGGLQLAKGQGEKSAPQILCERADSCHCMSGTMASCQAEVSRIKNTAFAVCVAEAECSVICSEDKALVKIEACRAEFGDLEKPAGAKFRKVRR
jgi:hypothetical protein